MREIHKTNEREQCGKVVSLLTIQGYYDGANIRLLERISAKPNQKVMITIVDEFVEPEQPLKAKSLRGVLSEYANPSLIEKEKGAWERAAAEKYGNV